MDGGLSLNCVGAAVWAVQASTLLLVGDAYGRNSAQVELVLGRLRELPPRGWKSLEVAHARAKTIDAAQDALATVLTTAGLRPSWFELRATVKTIAEKAAADYAALTHEAPRTIEHVASVNAWDGQHEKSSLEVLAPEHERAFMDAACDALGVVLIRAYVSEPEFARFWAAYELVFADLP
jgi:hypothetical protein